MSRRCARSRQTNGSGFCFVTHSARPDDRLVSAVFVAGERRRVGAPRRHVSMPPRRHWRLCGLCGFGHARGHTRHSDRLPRIAVQSLNSDHGCAEDSHIKRSNEAFDALELRQSRDGVQNEVVRGSGRPGVLPKGAWVGAAELIRWRGRGRQAARAYSDPPGIQRHNPGRDQVRGSLRQVVHGSLVLAVWVALTAADPDQLLSCIPVSSDSVLVIAVHHPGQLSGRSVIARSKPLVQSSQSVSSCRGSISKTGT